MVMYSYFPMGFPFATSLGFPYPLPVHRRHMTAGISGGDVHQFPRPMDYIDFFAPSPAAMLPPVSSIPLNLHPGSSSWRGFPNLFSCFPKAIYISLHKATSSSFPKGVFLGFFSLYCMAIYSPFWACPAFRDCWSHFVPWTILVSCGLFSLMALFISSALHYPALICR